MDVERTLHSDLAQPANTLGSPTEPPPCCNPVYCNPLYCNPTYCKRVSLCGSDPRRGFTERKPFSRLISADEQVNCRERALTAPSVRLRRLKGRCPAHRRPPSPYSCDPCPHVRARPTTRRETLA